MFVHLKIFLNYNNIFISVDVIIRLLLSKPARKRRWKIYFLLPPTKAVPKMTTGVVWFWIISRTFSPVVVGGIKTLSAVVFSTVPVFSPTWWADIVGYRWWFRSLPINRFDYTSTSRVVGEKTRIGKTQI